LVVRLTAHGPFHKLHPAAVGFELLDQDHLMNIVARQPIRGKDHNDFEFSEARLVAQGIEGGSP
jgi:hypothetical protein